MRIHTRFFVAAVLPAAVACARTSGPKDSTASPAGVESNGVSISTNEVIDPARSAKLFQQVTVSGPRSKAAGFITTELSGQWFSQIIAHRKSPFALVSPVVGTQGVSLDKMLLTIPFARDLVTKGSGMRGAVAVTDGHTVKLFPLELPSGDGITGQLKIAFSDSSGDVMKVAVGIVIAPADSNLALAGVASAVVEIDLTAFLAPASSATAVPTDAPTCSSGDPSMPPPLASAAPAAEFSAVNAGLNLTGAAPSAGPQQSPAPSMPKASFAPYTWGACDVNSEGDARQLQILRTCYGRAQVPEGAGGGYLGNVMGRPKCTDVGPFVGDQVRKCVKEEAAKLGLNPNTMVFQPCSVYRHGFIGGHEYMGICRVNNGRVTDPQLCAWTDPWQALDDFYQPGTGVNRPSHQVTINL